MTTAFTRFVTLSSEVIGKRAPPSVGVNTTCAKHAPERASLCVQVYIGNIDFEVELKKIEGIVRKYGEVADIIMKTGAYAHDIAPRNHAQAHREQAGHK
jgi:hypothetical protein